jgi:hypothetical protein
MTDIDATLAERGGRYGGFPGHAKIPQDIKRAMRQGNWDRLADDQKEAMEMVAHKFGRILNGDPDYHDSWHDCVGYLKLVADRLGNGAKVHASAPLVLLSNTHGLMVHKDTVLPFVLPGELMHVRVDDWVVFDELPSAIQSRLNNNGTFHRWYTIAKKQDEKQQ